MYFRNLNLKPNNKYDEIGFSKNGKNRKTSRMVIACKNQLYLLSKLTLPSNKLMIMRFNYNVIVLIDLTYYSFMICKSFT